ncbi:MAG TPA: M23 family metallopeptidase [Anaerolineales bacterium]|nr:M23 family metallopeptidase [Anaerolineales bacterium]
MRVNRPAVLGVFLVLVVLATLTGYYLYRGYAAGVSRSGRVLAWLRDSAAHPEWALRAGDRCGEAPFAYPTDGFIGYLWGDSFRPGHRHQGLDIFGGQELNATPVLAAYPGFLTRLPDWKSSVIIRIPQDPLLPGRQIWTYYTHMADAQGNSYIDPAFPPGTQELFVEAGTLVGYQGNYSGDPFNPTGIHLHFSIVQDDGDGSFRNELEIENTLDPSPYLGLPVSVGTNQGEIPRCNLAGAAELSQ